MPYNEPAKSQSHFSIGKTMSTQNEAPSESLPSFEEQVNSLTKQLTLGADELWHLPTDVEAPPEVLFAARTEKRRRDTESKLGRTTQQLKAKEIEATELRQLVQQHVKMDMSVTDANRLTELKFSDPDAWRTEISRLEHAAKQKIEEDFSKIDGIASQQAELARRAQLLTDYNAANPKYVLNDDVLANDIPPRITRKLETGKATFEEFLEEANQYLSAGKVVGGPSVEQQPNLNNAGGGAAPSARAVEGDLITSYGKTIF